MGGCSNKCVCKQYPPLKLYNEPPDIVMTIPASKGKDAEIKALRDGLQKVVNKVVVQKELLRGYKEQIIRYNTWLKKNKKGLK